MKALHALKDALDAIPHRVQAQVSAPTLRKELGDLPDEVVRILQLVSGETLNLISALAASYRGDEAKPPFSSARPQFPAEHKQSIEALCAQVLADPIDLENRVIVLLQTMRTQLTSDVEQLRRYERAQQLLSNLVIKAADASHDLFEGVR